MRYLVGGAEAGAARSRGAGVHFRGVVVTGPGGRQIVPGDPSGDPAELFRPAA